MCIRDRFGGVGATEEELFEARLERAETEEEREQLRHDERIRLIREERQAREDAAAEEQRMIEMTRQAEEQAAQEKMDLDEMAGELARAQDRESLNTLIGILGEGSAAGRAIAVTQATISGIEGVQNAYTTCLLYTSPSPRDS